jgi:hypothetical protein
MVHPGCHVTFGETQVLRVEAISVSCQHTEVVAQPRLLPAFSTWPPVLFHHTQILPPP